MLLSVNHMTFVPPYLQEEREREEEYFDYLEKKENIEEKMASLKELRVNVVQCKLVSKNNSKYWCLHLMYSQSCTVQIHCWISEWTVQKRATSHLSFQGNEEMFPMQGVPWKMLCVQRPLPCRSLQEVWWNVIWGNIFLQGEKRAKTPNRTATPTRRRGKILKQLEIIIFIRINLCLIGDFFTTSMQRSD